MAKDISDTSHRFSTCDACLGETLADVAREVWAVRMRLENGHVFHEHVHDEDAARHMAANPPKGWKVTDVVAVSRWTATTEWEER